MKLLAARHALTGTPERYRSGTAVVSRLGEAVLELYSPLAAGDADVEVGVTVYDDCAQLRSCGARASERGISLQS